MQPIVPPQNLIDKYPNLEKLILQPPEGVPEEDCGTLPALQGNVSGGIYDGGNVFRTFWTLTVDDLVNIHRGGVIEIAFFTNAVPPTAMIVHEP